MLTGFFNFADSIDKVATFTAQLILSMNKFFSKEKQVDFLFIFFLCLLSLIVNYVIYYFFLNNTTKNFTPELHAKYYSEGIYRFRILGYIIVNWVYAVLSKIELPLFLIPNTNNIKSSDILFDTTYYASFFLVNTISILLIVGTLYWYLKQKTRLTSKKTFIVMLLVLINIFLGSFVISAYDCLSYLFLVLATMFYFDHRSVSYILSLLFGILGVLTRESAFLIFPLLLITTKFTSRKEMIKLAITLAAYTTAYLFLRVHFGFEHSVYQDLQLYNNIYLNKSYFGPVCFGLMIGVLTQLLDTDMNRYYIFLLYMAPYFVFITIFAMLVEYRLFVPIIILSLFVPRNKKFGETSKVTLNTNN